MKVEPTGFAEGVWGVKEEKEARKVKGFVRAFGRKEGFLPETGRTGVRAGEDGVLRDKVLEGEMGVLLGWHLVLDLMGSWLRECWI